MTEQQAKEILLLKDVEKISQAIIKAGYRSASDDDGWEFSYELIKKDCERKRQVKIEDKENKKAYEIQIYKNGTKYKDIIFIQLWKYNIITKYDNLLIPQNSLLFTDAPYNEEYEKERNKIVKCPTCGRETVKKKLIKSCGKEICIGCIEIMAMNDLILEEIERVEAKRKRRRKKQLAKQKQEKK